MIIQIYIYNINYFLFYNLCCPFYLLFKFIYVFMIIDSVHDDHWGAAQIEIMSLQE